MKLAIAAFASIGFLVSASVHIASLRGIVLGGEPLLAAYFAGAIVLFIPTVITVNREYPGFGSRIGWSDLLADCPAPVRILLYGVVVYAVVNFALLLGQGAKTRHRSGEPLEASTARGLSGHAMAFYMISVAVMLSARQHENKRGHADPHSSR
jgi:hypothetical protein